MPEVQVDIVVIRCLQSGSDFCKYAVHVRRTEDLGRIDFGRDE